MSSYTSGGMSTTIPTYPSRSTGAYATHAMAMVQLPGVHPQTVRPTERSPRAQNPDAKSRGTRDNAERLRHVEPAHTDHPISYLDTLSKTGSESIDATIMRSWRRILFAGFVARRETVEMRDVRRAGGGRGMRWGLGKRVDEVVSWRLDHWTTQSRD